MDFKKTGKSRVDALFEKMVGLCFESYAEMEQWFRRELDAKLPQLSIVECDSVNVAVENGTMDVNYSTDCTFGLNMFGMEYADFIIDYTLDDQNRMCVAYVTWN